MLSCDYNGWNDAPEEEREWFDQHPEIWLEQQPEAPSRAIRGRRRRHTPPSSGGLAA